MLERLHGGGGHAVVVAGSENWNPDDRHLGRANVRSLQLFESSGVTHLSAFEAWCERGVRDWVLLDEHRLLLVSGPTVIEFDLRAESAETVPLDGAADLHEIWRDGDQVFIANTAFDQVIELDLLSWAVERHDIVRFRHTGAQPIAHGRPLGGVIPLGPKPVRDDHFHLNQGFVVNGQLHAVVHHVSGYRPRAHLRKRLTGHGDGGILNLVTDEVFPLGLRAPHSLRTLPGGGFGILDSGRGEAVVLDDEFVEIRRFPVGGWGRGLDITPDGTWYVGLSETRRRYLEPGQAPDSCSLAVFEPDGTCVTRVPLPCVEQVWAVQVVTEATAQILRSGLVEPPSM